MYAVGALRRESPGGLGRRLVVERHGLAFALQQPDHASAHEVDGGPEREPIAAHAVSPRRKFESRSRPFSDDFSGWNWQPQTFPRCTIAGNSPP